MPIRVCCPKCNETADLPDEARGKAGVCNRCGSPVKIPDEEKSVCVFCKADVTDAAHVKDPDKNHVCETCWKGRHPQPPRLQDTVAPSPTPASDAIATTTLDPDFATPEPAADVARPPTDLEHHDHDSGDDHVHDWPYDHRPSPSRRRPRPRRASRLSTVFSVLALLLSGASAYWTWTHQAAQGGASAPSWEDAHRAQILVLKGQAELLIEIGHIKEGIDRYEQLQRLVKDKTIADPALRDELKAAWHARDTAVSKDTVTEQVAQATAGASPTSIPAATTITLIEEQPDRPTPPKPAHASPPPTTQRSTFDPN